MTTSRANVSWPTTILLVVVAGMLGYQSQANRPVQAPPVAVATVNLETIFKKLTERSAADNQLTALAEQLDSEGQSRREGLEMLRQDLELHPPGSRQAQEAENELARKSYELQAYIDFAVRKLDSAKAKNLRRLYRRIKEAANQVAEVEGYDLIVVDDSIVEVPAGLTEAETMRQISARRLLSRNPQIDITDAVIRYMNDRFSQGG